jgi:hypothetical protein
VAASTVGAFLVASAALKLVRPAGAAEALQAARLPRGLAAPAARAVAVLELAVASALLAVPGGAALGAAAALLVVFSGFLAYLAVRRPGTPCGCLGDLGSSDHRIGLGRNAALLALVAVAALGGAPGPDALAVAVGVQLALVVAVATEGIVLARGLRALTSGLEVRP